MTKGVYAHLDAQVAQEGPNEPAQEPQVLPPTRVSPTGERLLHEREGLRLTAYQCSAGVWTIGFGTTRIQGRPVRPGEKITREQAVALYREDLAVFEDAVLAAVNVPLTQDQFDALVSLAYNIGVGALRTSTLVRLLNQGDYQGAADAFRSWRMANGRVDQGLVNRREAEREQFLGLSHHPRIIR